MKKLLTFFLTALLAFAVGWAETTTATFEVTSTGGGLLSEIKSTNPIVSTGGVTLTFDIGTHSNSWPAYYSNSGSVRLYSGNTLTVSCATDKVIKSIVFTYHTNYTNTDLSLSTGQPGTYNADNDTWTGSSSSVQFSNNNSGRTQFYRVVVTIDDANGGSTVETCAAPQFSPDGGSSTTGSLDVTITSATEGATIYYTTDNTDPVVSRSSIANGGTVTLTESCTLKAMAVKSGMDNSPIATSQSYTITSSGGTPSSSTIYTKVTDPNLVPGLNYILVYGTVGMGTYSSGKGVAITGLTTLPNNKVDINGKDVIVFTAGGTVNAYTFIANNNYLAYNSSTNLKESTTLDDKARWTLVGNSSDGYYLINNGKNTRGVIYNGTQFGAYATSNLGNNYYPAYLYVQEEQSIDPTLSVSTNALSISVPYDQSSATATFTVTGANLENNNVTVSVSGADFSVSPTSITPDANGAVNAETITVTYNGTSTTPVTGTVTVTCGNLSETVTVTAQKELPPPASITVNPSTLTINDSGTGNTFTVEGSNLGSDNVGVTQTNNNFTPTLSATTGTTYDGGSYRGFTPAGGEVNGTVAMSYTGRELSATETVTLANNLTSATVTVNYIADLYIVTDNGVTGDWHFDGTNGVPMTYNNGVYSAAFTVNNPNTYILFARKTGEGVTWNTRYVFGPNSNGDWELPSSGNGGGSIDLNDDDPIKIQGTGTYIVTIDANTGTFSIVKKTIGANDFILVTKTNDVTANDDYVLVYGEAYAMGTTLSSSNGGYYNDVTSGFTVDNNIVSLSDGYTVNVFTLLDAGDDKFFMQSENGNYIGVNGNNLIQSTSTPTADTYKWSITISNNSAVIQNASTNRYLAYNTTSPRYNTYQSITTNSAQQYASLYKRGTTQPRITVDPSSLEFVIPAGGTSQEKTVTVTETNTTGTTSVEISGDGASNFTASLNNGTLTVTYNGTATQANPDVATVTLTNGEANAEVAVTGYRLPLTVSITPASSTFSGSTMSGITLESNVTGATLEYRVDGGQWMTYSEAFAVTAATVGQIVTVEARATYNGETSAIATATYERVAKSNTLFTKVTDASQIKAGNKYIFVYEQGPAALCNWGDAEDGVSWHGTDVIDIAGTTTSVFTMNGTASAASFWLMDGNEQTYLSRSSKQTYPSSTEATFQVTNDGQSGYYLKDASGYIMRYNGQASDPFRWYDTSTGNVVFLYVQGGVIQAPEITPATGTYYESQTVSISDESDDVTIWYTTDGTDPATSATRQQYNGEFTAPYNAGSETTIIAVAIDEEDNVSEPATVTYTWGLPTATIAPATSSVSTPSVTVSITGTPAGAVIYYTTDGSEPTASNGTQYEGPFDVQLPEIGSEATVKAIAVYNGQTSTVAQATYTRVEKVINVNAPFFSPLQNQTYYGNQTLQMGCTTPNADIHYEIVEVNGTEAPSAAYVNDPTNVSTYYNGQTINMTEGHSYYVKAIAYVGNCASTVSEGWYTVKSFSDFQAEHAGDVYTYVANCAEFNALTTTGADVSFTNPVQVVYHSTYTNNGTFAEYCYVRDNTGYACIYFGKRDDSGKTIFKMGDWINGYYIAGEMNIWENNFHNQLGTNSHAVEYWPSSTLGWSEIIPTTTTCLAVSSGTTDGDNLWGNYVHLRNTTLSEVHDYNTSDPKHTGTITDASGSDTYYDKFYLWSAGTCSYNGHNDVIQHKGDYDQAFFTAKQEAGATFDVYGIVDYYKPYEKPFEICPIDFLWIYQPVITVPSNDQCTAPFTTTITVDQPEWTDIAPTIYYKTNEMEDWEEYTPGQLISISSTTTVMTYAEVPAQKTDGTNYNDYIRSLTDTATYVFPAVKDPIILPEGDTYDKNVTPSVEVTVQTNPESSTGTVTYYTLDGTDPRTSETRIELTVENATFTVSENTTVNAASCLELNGNTIWSNVVSETYQFIENDNNVYELLESEPVIGNIYVIVNKADKVGLSNTQNATNRAATGVMFQDPETKKYVYGNSDLATFVLEAATAGRYYLRSLDGDGYLCVNTNANPNLVTGARGSYAEATVSVNSNVTSGVDESYPATVMMSYDGTRRYLRYYSAGRTFTTYDAATTNQDIFLYGKQIVELNPPTITPASQLVQVTTGNEHIDATVTTDATSAQNGAKTVYTLDGSDPRYSNNVFEMDGNSEIIGFINTTTTVRAASYIVYNGTKIWSDVARETYTFVGVKEPIITPASGLFATGTTVNVTVTTNPQNTQEGVQTYYTTDGSDPRTSGTLINGNSTTLTVTGNTTVQAASCVEVNGVTLWSIVVSETYRFTEPTPLSVIERDGVKNNDYIVADELIGTWAVYDGNTRLLWAKDQAPYQANDLRPGKTAKQGDYVKELLKYQNDEWDQSNWVVLDMSSVTMSPEDLVGQKIKAGTIIGKYTDDVNFTIKLSQNPDPDGNATGKNYTGWTYGFEAMGQYYDRSYNTYVPANFMAENDAVNNLNRIDPETGFVVGATAGELALTGCQGDSLYFVNPKIQEVARIWGVWKGNDQFTIYTVGRDTVNNRVTNINAWDLKGSFNVAWDYNRVNQAYDYQKPSGLIVGEAYEFHAAIMKPKTSSLMRIKPSADSETAASSSYMVYPLDMPEDPIPTAVREVITPKTVVAVSYYNLMGIESSKPFDGINIVVTRYSDGTSSAVKVLR